MARRKRNLWGPAILAGILWLLVGAIVWWIEPERIRDIPLPGSYGVFFGLVFLAVGVTAMTAWRNSRRGLLTGLVVTTFLILRLIKLGHWLNGLLLVGVAIAIDSVFTTRV